MSRLELATGQISRVRGYTLRLLDKVEPADWFRQPSEGVTHIAWQVGHLAMAEYRLALERIRGRKPEDTKLIPDDFVRRFQRQSIPSADPAENPTPSELR